MKEKIQSEVKLIVKECVRSGTLFSIALLLGILLTACEDENSNPYQITPVITIDQPTSEPTYSISESSIRLSGVIEYSSRAYVTNSRTGQTIEGTVTVIGGQLLWQADVTDLQPGDNPITVIAHLYGGPYGYAYITITRTQ